MTAVFAGSADQVRHARHFAQAMLAGWPVADDTALCVSELAANAVVHSASRDGGKFCVHLETFPGEYVWVEVRDEGGPWLRRDQQDGRPHGLDIVRALASDFGVDGDARSGWIVWARLDLPKTGKAVASGTGIPDHQAPVTESPPPNGHQSWPDTAGAHPSSSRPSWRG